MHSRIESVKKARILEQLRKKASLMFTKKLIAGKAEEKGGSSIIKGGMNLQSLASSMSPRK